MPATMAGSLAPLVLLFLLVSTAAPVVVRGSPYSDNLQDACNKTLFPKVCIQSLTTNPETRTADARRLAELSVYVAKEVGTTVAAFAHHELSGVKEDLLFKCLDSCSDDIEETVAHLSALTRELTDAKFLEVKSWLSATLGGSSTCEESCKDAPISEVKNAVVTKSLEFEKLLRVTLDLITEASGSMSADVAVPPTAWDASAPGGSYGSASAPGYGSAGAPESYEASSSGSHRAAPSYGDSQPASSEAPSTSGSDAAAPSTGDSQPSSDAAAPSTGDSQPSSEAPSAGSDAAAPTTGDSAPSSEAPSAGSDAAAPSYGDSQPSAEAPTSGSDAAAPSPGSDAPSTSEGPAPSSGAASGPAADAPAPY